MGDLPLEAHWKRLVKRSCEDYFTSEAALIAASHSADQAETHEIGLEALRHGMIAAVFLHHFSEVAVERNAFDDESMTLAKVREHLKSMLTDIGYPSDGKILRDVADSIKHAELSEKHGPKMVALRGRTIELSTFVNDFGDANEPGTPWRVGVITYIDGVEQPERRSLKLVIENVMLAWSMLINVG